MRIKAAVLEEMGLDRPYSETLPLKVQMTDLEGPGPGGSPCAHGGRGSLSSGSVRYGGKPAAPLADGVGP